MGETQDGGVGDGRSQVGKEQESKLQSKLNTKIIFIHKFSCL